MIQQYSALLPPDTSLTLLASRPGPDHNMRLGGTTRINFSF